MIKYSSPKWVNLLLNGALKPTQLFSRFNFPKGTTLAHSPVFKALGRKALRGEYMEAPINFATGIKNTMSDLPMPKPPIMFRDTPNFSVLSSPEYLTQLKTQIAPGKAKEHIMMKKMWDYDAVPDDASKGLVMKLLNSYAVSNKNQVYGLLPKNVNKQITPELHNATLATLRHELGHLQTSGHEAARGLRIANIINKYLPIKPNPAINNYDELIGQEAVGHWRATLNPLTNKGSAQAVKMPVQKLIQTSPQTVINYEKFLETKGITKAKYPNIYARLMSTMSHLVQHYHAKPLI